MEISGIVNFRCCNRLIWQIISLLIIYKEKDKLANVTRVTKPALKSWVIPPEQTI